MPLSFDPDPHPATSASLQDLSHRGGGSGGLNTGDDVPLHICVDDGWQLHFRLIQLAKCNHRLLCTPSLEDIDARGVKRISGLHEVQAPFGRARLSSHIMNQIQVGLAVRRIQNQVASDDQHVRLGPCSSFDGLLPRVTPCHHHAREQCDQQGEGHDQAEGLIPGCGESHRVILGDQDEYDQTDGQ